MKPNHPLRTFLLAASTAALLAGPAYAERYNFESPRLYEQMEGDVAYVTGGIGEAELAELERAKPAYNLHVTSTDTTGAYVSDTAVVIQDRQGHDILATRTGPLLFVNLPAGRYKLLAENAGVAQVKNITVPSKKSAKVHLGWKLPQ